MLVSIEKTNPSTPQKTCIFISKKQTFTVSEPCLELKGELAVVDKILDDETFLTPFIEKFNSKCGRHSTPVDTYIRMMYLKFRYNLGYETLCKEISDSISWKVFCHIPVCAEVPDYTTLAKLTKRFGEDTLREIKLTYSSKSPGEKTNKS